MALSFGWRANDVRDSIWKGDPALVNVPAGALDAWQEDGDASHLEPYATAGDPTIIRFRALTPDEKPIVMGVMAGADSNIEGANRAWIRCFRMGVSFDGMEESAKDEYGAKRRMTVKERGIPMLANEVVMDLESKYPGIVVFYGALIFNASFLSDAEKKASSPPSTETPSQAAVSTVAITAPPPAAEAATGAP
jgi:hypothetical protein